MYQVPGILLTNDFLKSRTSAIADGASTDVTQANSTTARRRDSLPPLPKQSMTQAAGVDRPPAMLFLGLGTFKYENTFNDFSLERAAETHAQKIENCISDNVSFSHALYRSPSSTEGNFVKQQGLPGVGEHELAP